jgi:hypothetical protein
MNLSFYSQRGLAFAQDAPLRMAIGVCAHCCMPLHDENALRSEGCAHLFCSPECASKFQDRDHCDW